MSGDAHPWIRGDLRIDAAVLADIEAHSVECYPSEACGFVSGPAAQPAVLDASIREVNEADKYHKMDPITFPRTSETYFKLNELRAARAFESGERDGQPIKVIYHSHVDCEAYFSPEDAYTFASEGQLMWPCAFLVISVVRGEVAQRRLWVHKPGTDDFVESTITVA